MELPLDQDDLLATLGHFWHPVCHSADVPTGLLLGVRLLERDIAVARLADGSLSALADRCVHRSTRLSVGTVDGCNVRCAYHGWTWASDGRCTSIPSLPDGPIPSKAVVESYDVTEQYDMVWVRLVRSKAGTPSSTIPHCSAHGDPSLHVIVGAPYTWPVAALRRVENFVDLAHFAWVHDGSLGRRDEPVPPLPNIERARGEMRFVYEPPDFQPDSAAMYGRSSYRMPMPCTVDIEFQLTTGARRILWMTASPIDRTTCRTFWFMARDDDLDEPGLDVRDQEHIEFQRLVLSEDEPVVCAQVPGEFPLDPSAELSVATDLVSNVYRHWVRELVRAYTSGGTAALAAAAAFISDTSEAASPSSSHDARTPSSATLTMSSKS
jgi:phenylpropionate dioxygenase-like ring-hydroxylating dioxygenase large terminal subunit